MREKIVFMSIQLCSSQMQLKALKRSSARGKRQVSCIKKEGEKKSFEQEIHRIQAKADETVERELEVLGLDEATCDCQELKESNRLLINEVQERRESAKYARKQYMVAIRKKKELSKAVAMYKEKIASRDKDMEKYKAAVRKYTQQLNDAWMLTRQNIRYWSR
ncbi:hypothetical protein PsorP6_003504 [Peronosclerospora sorghi]|uniref:Uncharacterized protein n=1 Tax=Peronosclerospora sorghi TaxID=230839 RepID=A0ACC0VPV1_9STRA|nr:hypothetical protein PsorP6_003504 [Peronosclerospora sorghi]